MSIINESLITATKIAELMERADAIVANTLKEGYALLAEAENPQEVLDTFGENAAVIFGRYESYRALHPSSPAPSGSFSVNENGKVTFTPVEVDESEEVLPKLEGGAENDPA